MHGNNKKQLLRALLIMFRPVARIFLHSGLGQKELVELAKTAFVQVASEDYGLRGRPTNASRVAAMTGLSRKEVRRLRQKICAGDAASVTTQTPVYDVLDLWRTSPDFRRADGRPRDLPMRGKPNSFAALVKRACGDLPPGALLTELQRIGAVRRRDESTIALAADAAKVTNGERLSTQLSDAAAPLLRAIARSQVTDDDAETAPPVASLSVADVAAADLPRMQNIVKQRFAGVMAELKQLFAAYRTLHDGDPASASRHRITVGHFYEEHAARGR